MRRTSIDLPAVSVTGRDAAFSGVADGGQVAAALHVVHHELAYGAPGERLQGVASPLQVRPRRGGELEVVAGHRRPVLVLDHVRDQLRTRQSKTKLRRKSISSRSLTGLSQR
jgi:hypothetical protein